MPFWSPPPWLRKASAAARLLVRTACVALPGFILGASILPEGLREYAPLPLRLALSLAALLLKLCLLVGLVLPLSLVTLAASGAGTCVAFAALWLARSAAWVSALALVASVNATTAGLVACRGCALALLRLTVSRGQNASAQLPPRPAPSASLHEIRALHALVGKLGDQRRVHTDSEASLAWFAVCSDLVACSASLSVHLLNELALKHEAAAMSGGRLGLLDPPRGGGGGGGSVRALVRHLATLALALQAGACLYHLVAVLAGGKGAVRVVGDVSGATAGSSPGDAKGGAMGPHQSTGPSLEDPGKGGGDDGGDDSDFSGSTDGGSGGVVDSSSASEVVSRGKKKAKRKSTKKERRRRLVSDSEDEDESDSDPGG